MSHFKNILGSEETLFRDPVLLDYDYVPKLINYRDGQKQHIAMCMKPLFLERNARNAFLHGPPGIGKTVVCKDLLREIEDETDDIEPIYINCWQKNTTYKIILEISDIIGYRFTHNKKSDELFKIIKDLLNKKSVVFVLDEVDKVEDLDFIYYALEDIYRKSIILITNHKEWIIDLDQRVKSRLTAEMVEFKPYNKEETTGILKERIKYAFVPGVWDDDVFEYAAERAYQVGDIRAGLYILKEAGNAAEDVASKKITKEHVDKAITKLNEFSIKKSEELEDETKFILDLIKSNSGKKIGDIYKEYQKEGGSAVYKTFQRKVRKLSDNRFISVKKITGGKEGSTTIITHLGSVKTLDEFK